MPLKIGLFALKGQTSFLNHPFSGVNMLVSGMVFLKC